MISINELQFSYGSNLVLGGIDLQLESGKIYGLLGENGVGKTTLLTLLSGLKKVQTGTIDIDGENPYSRKPSLLSRIIYLPEEVAPMNLKSINYAKSLGAFYPKFDLDKFLEIANVFGLDTNKKMNNLSSGQLKKVHISFSLACNTDYLFLDEPTNSLDIPSKSQFRSAITKYTSEDSTIIISTHQVRDLENIIDPIIILDNKDVLLNASMSQISEKLFFDYGNEVNPNTLYREMLPGGQIQVYPNSIGEESKVSLEALFNAVMLNKDLIKTLFNE